MERALPEAAVVDDAQPRRLGFLNDQPAQHLDLGRLALPRRVSVSQPDAGHRLKRPTDKLFAN
jgi:hypothetical protein